MGLARRRTPYVIFLVHSNRPHKSTNFAPLAFSSHKSSQPVQSIPSALYTAHNLISISSRTLSKVYLYAKLQYYSENFEKVLHVKIIPIYRVVRSVSLPIYMCALQSGAEKVPNCFQWPPFHTINEISCNILRLPKASFHSPS